MAKGAYPVWKKVAWRYGRIFVGAFLVSISEQYVRLGDIEAWKAVVQAAIVAAIAATGKAIREEYGTAYPILTKLFI